MTEQQDVCSKKEACSATALAVMSECSQAAEMTRRPFDNRRQPVLLDLEYPGTTCAASAGFFTDGGVGDVFLTGARTGSYIDALLADAAVQHGDDLADFAKAMGRDGYGVTPSSTIGAALGIMARR